MPADPATSPVAAGSEQAYWLAVTDENRSMQKIAASEGEIRKGAQVMSTQMAADYTPPSASMNPAASVIPTASANSSATVPPATPSNPASAAQTE